MKRAFFVTSLLVAISLLSCLQIRDQLSAFESGLQLNYSFHKTYLYFSCCISPFSLFSNYVFSITSNLFCTAQKGKYLKQFLVTCLHVSISFANCKSGMC